MVSNRKILQRGNFGIKPTGGIKRGGERSDFSFSPPPPPPSRQPSSFLWPLILLLLIFAIWLTIKLVREGKRKRLKKLYEKIKSTELAKTGE